jgi:hypothetical protein
VDICKLFDITQLAGYEPSILLGKLEAFGNTVALKLIDVNENHLTIAVPVPARETAGKMIDLVQQVNFIQKMSLKLK